ncbi:MAG TPA: pantetheine-phosphate adenylyltransferase [Poseidonia sp.]|nr:pantetheine-phosphate adenylyltransferase [Poseidonia sp.]
MELPETFACCLVGGTFDRFHAGHSLLLNAAKKAAKRIEIHVTSDLVAEAKSPFIQSFENRREVLLQWAEKNAPGRVTIHILSDVMGPAPVHKEADCIVASPETRGQCEAINETRVQNGLSTLEIIEVSHMHDIKGGIISSSRIRNGHIDQQGHPWIESHYRENTLLMHPRLDAELKTPMGVLFEGPEEAPEVAMYAALDDLDLSIMALIAVGDVTVTTLLDMGYVPDVGLIDGQTKRTPLAKEKQVNTERFASIINAENPPGQLTPSLLTAIEQACSSDEPTLIDVEGEEDLAPLYIHLVAPIGSQIIYGQPGKGVVLQQTTLETKKRCRNLLGFFEVK